MLSSRRLVPDDAVATMNDSRPVHLPAIDRLKGVAILWVMCIHANFGEGTIFFEHFVNRAVPIFLFLFGVTSEFWWEGRASRGGGAPRDWFTGRIRRLLVPYWAMAAAWWIALVATGLTGGRAPAVEDVLLTFAVFAPWIGMSWFVTLIVQLVALFPLVRRWTLRVRPLVSLAIGAAVTGASARFTYEVIDTSVYLFGNKVPPPAWYYSWIFAPRALFPLVAGILVASRSRGRPSKALTALGLACVPIAYFVLQWLRTLPDDSLMGPLRNLVVFYLSDIPLCVGLLGLATMIPLPRVVARPLEWCGRASWGLYIGHLLVHEVVHMVDIVPEGGPQWVRAVYALFLLVTGLCLVLLGKAFLWAWSALSTRIKAPARTSSE